VEKLLSQEARRLGVQVTDDQVRLKLDQITREHFGNPEVFQAKLREEGMSREDLLHNLRSILILEGLKKVKTPEGADPEVSFNAWLIQAKQKAELVIYDSQAGGLSIPSGGSCCGPTGPSAEKSGQAGVGRSIDPKVEKEAEKAGLEAFRKSNPAERGVTARVTDYGCHLQVDIEKEGKVVKSYSYQRGKVFEIS